MMAAAPSRRELLLTLAFFAVLAWWAADDLREWARLLSAPPTAVQTSTPSGCRAPDPGEQLVIAERHGQLFAQCQYVMSRGAARSRWQGTVL